MPGKSSKWELVFDHYIMKFTILRFVILRFKCNNIWQISVLIVHEVICGIVFLTSRTNTLRNTMGYAPKITT